MKPEFSKSYLKTLVTKDELETLIDELLDKITQYQRFPDSVKLDKIQDALIILSGRLKSIRHQNLIGTTDVENVELNISKIRKSILDLINNLPDHIFQHFNLIENDSKESNDEAKMKSKIVYELENFKTKIFYPKLNTEGFTLAPEIPRVLFDKSVKKWGVEVDFNDAIFLLSEAWWYTDGLLLTYTDIFVKISWENIHKIELSKVKEISLSGNSLFIDSHEWSWMHFHLKKHKLPDLVEFLSNVVDIRKGKL